MNDFLERLKEEQKLLDEKINKLKLFIDTSKFKELNEVQRYWLRQQLGAMKNYNRCLIERLKDLKQ